MADAELAYQVEVIGFDETEGLMLSSIFNLAARRDPSFVQRTLDSTEPPDLYLVDADEPASLAQYRAASAEHPAPAVLIGTADHGTGLPLLARPMQWARVLQALDNAIQGQAGSGPSPTQFDKTLVFSRTGGGTRVPTPAPASRPPATAQNLRPADWVLVVDDNATVRHFMQEQLAPYRFNVDFAENGEQAVGLTAQRDYTCVFLDVVLPGIDGYQVCKLIKGNKQAMRRTAVVMLTSRTSPFDKLRGSLAGCDEYLTKPVDENRLLEVIAKFIPSARTRGSSKSQKGKSA